MRMDPKHFLWIGFVLMVLGVVLPLGMIMGWFPSTFFLNFLAWGSSFMGLILGMIGVAFFAVSRRRRDR